MSNSGLCGVTGAGHMWPTGEVSYPSSTRYYVMVHWGGAHVAHRWGELSLLYKICNGCGVTGAGHMWPTGEVSYPSSTRYVMVVGSLGRGTCGPQVRWAIPPLQDRKEIAFPIGVCSKMYLEKWGKSYRNLIYKTWAGNGSKWGGADSFLQIQNELSYPSCTRYVMVVGSLGRGTCGPQVRWAIPPLQGLM